MFVKLLVKSMTGIQVITYEISHVTILITYIEVNGNRREANLNLPGSSVLTSLVLKYNNLR
jgi:hypothetical protein